jgi:polyisoprenyl-phosphate glycosyltransferase
VKKLITYVFPIYNEAGNIELLYSTMAKMLADNPRYDYELIFVNDGSRDESLELLKKLHRFDHRVTVIEFARNFGHQIAVTAGLDHAKGDAVIIMDADMQDPPSVSFELVKKWEEGYEVVYAQRRTRKDTLFKRLTASLFYRTLRRLAEIEIPSNTGDFRLVDRLVDRKVVDEIKKFKEHNRFLRGMFSFVGFKQAAVQFDRDERHAGETGYPFMKMLRFAADGILSFSSTPLKFISMSGYVIAGISFLGVVYAVVVRLFFSPAAVPGWAFIVASILFIGGIQLIMLGVLGSYIGRIYTESQGRPLYIVKDIHGQDVAGQRAS